MRILVTFLILCFIPKAQAESRNAIMYLRAVVPEKLEYKLKLDNLKRPRYVVHSNSRKPASLPKILVKKRSTHTLVSIIQP